MPQVLSEQCILAVTIIGTVDAALYTIIKYSKTPIIRIPIMRIAKVCNGQLNMYMK